MTTKLFVRRCFMLAKVAIFCFMLAVVVAGVYTLCVSIGPSLIWKAPAAAVAFTLAYYVFDRIRALEGWANDER